MGDYMPEQLFGSKHATIIGDELAHSDGQRSVMILSLCFGGSEEAEHAMCIKGISSSPQTSRRQASFCARSTGGRP